MLSFTTLYQRTQDIIGTTDATALINIKMDINQGLRLFKNGARRYWTRTEKVADLVASQQYYTFPEDVVRVTEVQVSANGFNFPLTEIASEHKWKELNVIPAVTINVPQFYFVRGRNEIGLWPTPSVTTTGGLVMSYEPRMVDMTQDDVSSGTVTVTSGSNAVTASGTPFTQQMIGSYFTVTDGTDGNWYKISGFTSTSSITLENNYQGVSGAGRAYTVAQVPDIPEDYHLALVYYAAYNYFLKRKDVATATSYDSMFMELLREFKSTYSSKTTGVVTTTNLNGRSLNIFNVPPSAITGP